MTEAAGVLARVMRDRVARGTVWSLAGTLVARGCAVLASIGVARILGKHAFGEVGIVQSTLGMFQALAAIGLGLTATKYIAELRHLDGARAGRVLAIVQLSAVVLGATLTALVIALAPWVAAHVLDAPDLAGALRPGALLILFGVIAGAQSGALAGFEAFRAIAWISVVTGLATFPLMLLGAKLGGVTGAVTGSVIALGLGCVLNHVTLARLTREEQMVVDYGACRRELALLRSFSLPALITAVLVGPVTWIANTMLVHQHGGYEEMGVFNAANTWRSTVLFVPAALGAALLPVLSNLAGTGSWPEFRRLLRRNVIVSSVAALLVAAPVTLLAPFIMTSYGRDFTGGSTTLIVLMAATVLACPPNVLGQAMVSLGRMWAGAMLNALWAIVFLSAAWVLVDRGALGLAVAYAIAYVFHLGSSALYAYLVMFRR